MRNRGPTVGSMTIGLVPSKRPSLSQTRALSRVIPIVSPIVLDAAIQPKDRVVVVGDRPATLDLKVIDVDRYQMRTLDRLEAITRELGATTPTANQAFDKLPPD